MFSLTRFFTMVLKTGANNVFMLATTPVRLRDGNKFPLVTHPRNGRAGIPIPQSDYFPLH